MLELTVGDVGPVKIAVAVTVLHQAVCAARKIVQVARVDVVQSRTLPYRQWICCVRYPVPPTTTSMGLARLHRSVTYSVLWRRSSTGQ